MASSEISYGARFLRVLPYADFVALALNLGYAGYSLWNTYRSYYGQVNQDSDRGVSRDPSEVIELVIARRRRELMNEGRRQVDSSDDSNQSKQQPAIEGTSQYSQQTSRSANDQSNGTSQQGPVIDLVHTDDEDEDDKASETDGTSSFASTTLPSTDSTRAIVNDFDNDCFICSRALNNVKKSVASLPFCMHSFHKSCLDSVLRWHQRCPICDTHIFSPV